MKDNHGIPMTEEEIEEAKQVWTDIKESIELVMEEGEDL